MSAFIVAAAALLVAVLALLLRPLLVTRGVARPHRTLVGLALVVPLAAAGLYGVLGSANGLVGQPGPATEPQIETMVAALAARLEKNPGDKKGWVVLARSYMAMGRLIDSERAYDQAGDFIDGDAQELANFANVIASNANGHFNDKALRQIEKALKTDPNNTMALWLAGTAAHDGGDSKRAVEIWQKLLALLPPDSDDARELRGAIVQAGRTAPAVVPIDMAAPGAGVTGTVELGPKLRVAPGDIVMVIARVPGQRMPVAVMRVPASRLPLAFVLDDSLAMSPRARISTVTEVEVEARVSKTGQATAQPGDLYSSVQTVKVGAKGVTLRVANVKG